MDSNFSTSTNASLSYTYCQYRLPCGICKETHERCYENYQQTFTYLNQVTADQQLSKEKM